MKNSILLSILFFSLSILSYSQKSNGKMFTKHEAIDKTIEFWKAFEKGDKDAYLSFYSDEITFINNGVTNKQTKAYIPRHFDWWQKQFKNLKIENKVSSPPFVIVQNDKSIKVFDWQTITGRHIKTGVNLNQEIHHVYEFDKNGKISAIYFYYNNDVFEEIRNSASTKTNGEVYINHPYILVVRKLVNAIQDKDLETWSSYFTPEARFYNNSNPYAKYESMEEQKKYLKKYFIDTNLKLEQSGYPDCVYYEKGDSYVVYSWWKASIMKNNKPHDFVIMLSYRFNQEGKISYGFTYLSSNHFE